MADYNQNIKVTADVKQAESQLNRLTKALQNLQSDAFIDVGKAAASGGVKLAQKNLQEYGKTLSSIDRQLGGFGKRLGDIAKALDFGGKTVVGVAGLNALGTALSSLNGFATTGAAGIKTIGGLIAAIPKIVGGSITVLQGFGGALAAATAPAAKVAAGIAALGPQGLAAAGGIAAATAAFMAFSPAVKKVVTGLDNLVLGGKIQSAFDGIKGKVEGTKQSFLGLNTTIETTVQAMNELAEGMSLRQLNRQVSSLTKEMQSFNSATQEAWEAAQQLVRAQSAQVLEQKALNDLVRQAKGLQPQDVRDAEVSRRKSRLTSGRKAQQAAAQQAKDVDQLQEALLRLEQTSAAVENDKLEQRWKLDQAAAAKLREDTEALAEQLQQMNRAASSKGIRMTEASGRVQERKELEQSIKLIRERNALLRGNANQYAGLAGPGNDTRVNQPQYRAMVNNRAVTEASKTLQIQYNWNQALKQGAGIAADMRRIQAEDLKLQQQKVAEAYEQLSIKKREEDFERRLARLRQRNEERTQARKNFSDKAQGVAIGGAFPLLFGGGAGSVIGGALGGLNTTNPIFSVFTSAIGQMLDQWVATTTDLAKSLKNPTDAMAALEAAGYKVSDSTKNQVNRLLEVGRAYDAQSVVLAEVERKLGAGSVQALNALAGEQKKLQDQWDQMAGALQGELLPALVGTIALLNSLAAGAKVLSKLQLPKWFINFLTVTNPGFALSRAQFEDAQRRGRDVAGKVPARPPLDPLLAQSDADAALAKAERAEALRRQGLQLERQTQDLELQIADQVYGFRQRAADIERANLDLRRSIEEEIFKKRQDITRIEADNARQQAQLAIERLDMQLAGGRVSGNVPGQDLANQLTDAVRQYVKTRAEGEADLQLKERLHTIEMEDLKKASEKFRFDVARKVADLERQGAELTRDIERAKLTTARAIYDLQVAGADYQVAKAKEAMTEMVDGNQRLAATNGLTGQLGRAQSGGAFSKWDPALLKATGQLDQKYRVPLGTTASLVMFESSGNTAARGPDVGGGDRGHGLFQIMRGTARELGVNHQSILGMGGVQQMGLLDKYLMGRGFRPGMNPEQMYATVLGGNPWARSADLNGTTPGSGAAVQRGWRGSAAAAIRAAGGAAAAPTQVSPLFDWTKAGKGGAVPVTVVSASPTAAAAAPVARPSLPASVGQAKAQLGGVKIPGAANVSGALASLAALDTKLLSAKTNALELAKAFTQLNKEQALQVLSQSVQQITDQLNAPLDQLLKSQADAAAYQREYAELIMQGSTPALAEQVAQIREQVRLQLEQLDTAITQLEATKSKLEAEGKWTAELQAQLELLRAKQGVISGKGAAAEGNARADSKGKQIRDYMTKLRGELNDTEDMILSLAGTIEGAIGSAMSNAITGLIDGTMTVQQAMSQMFKNIGAAFIDMATQMIAKALVMKVLGIFAGGGGGGFSIGGVPDLPGLGGAGALAPGPKFFASGGFVTGPTRAVIGEGGESEYVIPAGKMGEAMNRYAAGRRGSSVIPDASGGGGGGGGSTFTLETVIINNVEYATVEQVRAMGQASAQQGASGGHARVMGDLRNKRSVRSRLGMA